MKIINTKIGYDDKAKNHDLIYELSAETPEEYAVIMTGKFTIQKLRDTNQTAILEIRVNFIPSGFKDTPAVDRSMPAELARIKPTPANPEKVKPIPAKKTRKPFSLSAEELKTALEENNFNINKTAKRFGIAWLTLSLKMKKYGLEVPEPFRSQRRRDLPLRDSADDNE